MNAAGEATIAGEQPVLLQLEERVGHDVVACTRQRREAFDVVLTVAGTPDTRGVGAQAVGDVTLTIEHQHLLAEVLDDKARSPRQRVKTGQGAVCDLVQLVETQSSPHFGPG